MNDSNPMNTSDTPASGPLAASTPPKGGHSVMIVDDDPAVLTIGKAMLSTLPYEVIAASSGEDALEKLRPLVATGRRPDIIVLDLTMPGGMSGLDTLQEIRALDPRIGIIACSGFFEQSAHDLCVALGFMDAIEKPYTSELLTSTVRKCITKLTESESEPTADPLAEVGPLVRRMMASSSVAPAEIGS